MTKHFSHLLLAFLLLCAQALAAAHAIEHVVEEGRGLPPHVCELCLAAHDLGAGLTGSHTAAKLPSASFTPYHYTLIGRAALPAPQARQQSPPTR